MTFGVDQCPACGSKQVEHVTHQKTGGGPNEIDDHVTVLDCNDCGFRGRRRG